MWRVVLPIVAVCLAACGDEPVWPGSLEDLLEAQPERFATVIRDPARYRLQIIYTRIDRDAANRPSFSTFAYRLDATEYFYPASTVKLPVAALALEKLHYLDRPGLDRDSIMVIGESESSVADDVRAVLLVSDNDAFNRLYDFVGQQPINEALARKGMQNSRIIHRLQVALSEEQNRHTAPVRFLRNGETVYQQDAARSRVRFASPVPQPLGVAEIVDGRRVDAPKDFASKNAYSLQDLHDTVQSIVFPGSMPPHRRFDLGEDNRRFLLRYLSEYPGESGIPSYADASKYPDGYVKFLMFGGDAPEVPARIRIFNKVGDAYGFLTDAAYVVDFDKRIEFLLAATIYVNANGTFNDDEYEYEEVGLPFLRDLGRAIYEIELARPREHAPDLDDLAGLRE